MHLVIDGNNILYMAYYAGKGVGLVSEERPTAHVKIMLNMLRKYVKEFKPDDVILCWDYRPEGYTNWRKEEAETYKGNRIKDDLIFSRIEDVMKMVSSLGIRQIHPKNCEADDIMYYLCAEKYRNNCLLISSDTDMYQLLDDYNAGFKIFSPRAKKMISSDVLNEKYMVNTGREFIIRKALKGDSADNIPGVYRIRKDRIEKVITEVLKDSTFETLKESGILKDNEFDVFLNNMKLMDLSSILDNTEEIEWYDEQLDKNPVADMDIFRNCVRNLDLWDVANNAAWYFKPFKDLQTEESDYVDISMFLRSYA